MKKELQSKDFRIGNFVERKETSEVIKIISISQNAVRTNRGTLPYNCLHPIPLTEEWLVKFGFERTEDEIHGEITWDYQRDIDSHECWAEWNERGQLEGVIVDCVNRLIKYVHELQNLYFALTGEELELKSETP